MREAQRLLQKKALYKAISPVSRSISVNTKQGNEHATIQGEMYLLSPGSHELSGYNTAVKSFTVVS